MSEAYDNADQAAFWSEGPGRKWVDQRAPMDAALAPVLDLVLDRAGLLPGQAVLDIGCGTGTSTLEIAERVGPGGHVQAVDIAESLLAEAARRAADTPNAAFMRADAQIHPFDPASFDVAVSRFGVMFFSDPVAAFRNMSAALKPGAPVVFAAWCGVGDNPWFGIPAKAAIARLGPVEPSVPRAPGPMAFEEADYITGILQAAGLTDVSVTREDILLTPLGDAAAVAALSTRIGPATRVIKERGATQDDIAAIQDAVAAQLAPYVQPGGVRIPAAIRFCTARVPV